MRQFYIVMSCAVLMSCNSKVEQSAKEPQKPSVETLLATGDARVCVDPDVQATAIAIANNAMYNEYVQAGGKPITFSAVNASKIDRSLKEVVCKASLLPPQGLVIPEPMLLEYAVRPTLDENGSFVVEVPNKPLLQQWVSAWVLLVPKPNTSAEEPRSPSVAPADDVSNPDGSTSDQSDWRGKSGRCRLTVNGQAYINGACWVKLETDGSFQIMGPDEAYFAQLSRSEGGAEGFWNETPNATHAQSKLGAMVRDGACWSNANAEICAWDK